MCECCLAGWMHRPAITHTHSHVNTHTHTHMNTTKAKCWVHTRLADSFDRKRVSFSKGRYCVDVFRIQVLRQSQLFWYSRPAEIVSIK